MHFYLWRSQFKMSSITWGSEENLRSSFRVRFWEMQVYLVKEQPGGFMRRCLGNCVSLHSDIPTLMNFLLTQHIQSRAAFINTMTFELAPWPLNSPSVLSARWQVSESNLSHVTHSHGTWTHTDKSIYILIGGGPQDVRWWTAAVKITSTKTKAHNCPDVLVTSTPPPKRLQQHDTLVGRTFPDTVSLLAWSRHVRA